MNMPTTRIAAVAAIALLTPASLAAQNHQMGQMGMAQGEMTMHSTDMPMMHASAMTPAPRMLLAQREPLGLSDQQVDRLEQLQDRLESAVTKHREAMGPLHEQLAGMQGAEKLDVGRYEKLLRQASDRRIALQVERARIGQEALQVLSEQQRSNVRYGMRMQRMMEPGYGMPSGQGMTGMMGGMGNGAMGGGMMGGAMTGAGMDHGRMMAMMQNMRQRMQKMQQSCAATSGSDGD